MRARPCTNAYPAKRAIFERLHAAQVPGSKLADVLIRYSDPGRLGEGIMLYGGGIVFDQSGENDLADGDDVLVAETAVLGLHIRVELAPDPGGAKDPVEATDEIAEEIGDEVSQLLADEPRLAGGMSVSRIVGGQCDHNITDTAAISVLTLRVSVESNL